MQNPFDTPIENALEKFTVNITLLARKGKIDPVIGRDGEIRRVVQILSRRTKNNPVLLGDPGVGKTAIVEGLASRIVDGDVPNSLKNKELLSLDVSSILAGASLRGEFEKRIRAILDEVEKGEGRYILFIDELHTIVNAGGGEGSVDAGNMLKPALARGLLHAIGATTVREYRQYIEKDPALERRFQPIFVDEPSVEDSIAILRGIKEKYEIHHGIKISDDAIIAAVNLSTRYITERFLPDKAIDLIDEASAGAKIEIDSMPTILDQLKRQMTRIDIELAALKRESNVDEHKGELEREREKLQQEFDEKHALWSEQKDIIQKLQKARLELDAKKVELEKAERDVMLNEAAVIKYQDIPNIQKEIEKLQKEWDKIPDDKRLLHEEVTETDIAAVIARWTGIPQSKLLATDTEKLTHLEDNIKQKVVGQDKAVHAVVAAIQRSRAGLNDEHKPIGSFLFLGPTGVGKTETAKALADSLFGDERALVRIDMSEYSQEHSIARLIGAPPGYIGYEEAGQLTEAVRRHPYSVILLDEVEKAHPSIFNTFLQVLDDGRLTDGKGRTVNFKNTIIIMTSNLGSEAFRNEKYTHEMQEIKVIDTARTFFRPEFINRLDAMIVFRALDEGMMKRIVDIQLDDVGQRLLKQHLHFEATDAVKKYLLTRGFDPVYGARPLKRVINESIIDEIADLIIRHSVDRGDTMIADVKKDVIFIKVKKVN